MAISLEQILAAADQLDAAGHSPTLAAVRKLIGGGSFTTISEAMSEWRKRKAALTVPNSIEPKPQAVTDKLSLLGDELWAIALDVANAKLKRERDTMQTVQQELEASRTEAVELSDQLNQELEQLQQQLQAQAADQLRLQTELQFMRERAISAEARAAELRTELNHAHSEATQLKQEVEAARHLVIEARENAALLRGRLQAQGSAEPEV